MPPFSRTIHSGYGVPRVACTLEAMFLRAFFGFLRCSEFIASTVLFDPSCHTCISDLFQFSEDASIFHLKQTKTKQIRQTDTGLLLQIQIATESFQSLENTTCRSENSKAPLRPNHYSFLSPVTWSLISGSTTGIPEHLIQILGCWSSQAYQIHPLQPQRSSAQSILL